MRLVEIGLRVGQKNRGQFRLATEVERANVEAAPADSATWPAVRGDARQIELLEAIQRGIGEVADNTKEERQ